MKTLKQSLRTAPLVERNGYTYFVHGVTDGIPPLEPVILREITDEIRERIDLEDVDLLVAPEAMGIHHAAALSLATGIPFVVVRKRAYGFPDEIPIHQETSYGEGELFLNHIEPSDRVVVLDDVLSSGGTLRVVLGGLEDIGAEMVACVVIIRRTDVDREPLPVEVTSLLDVRVEDGSVVLE